MSTSPDAPVTVEHRANDMVVRGPRRVLRQLTRRLPRTAWTRGTRPGELHVRASRAGDLDDLLRELGHPIGTHEVGDSP